jgi:hypothetical protein
MKLYIRKHRDMDTELWWERFSVWANQQSRTNKSLKVLIEVRRRELDRVGAKLKYEMDTGLPYLEFSNDQKAAWFMLKWA